jgi:hypothetical protein
MEAKKGFLSTRKRYPQPTHQQSAFNYVVFGLGASRTKDARGSSVVLSDFQKASYHDTRMTNSLHDRMEAILSILTTASPPNMRLWLIKPTYQARV